MSQEVNITPRFLLKEVGCETNKEDKDTELLEDPTFGDLPHSLSGSNAPGSRSLKKRPKPILKLE